MPGGIRPAAQVAGCWLACQCRLPANVAYQPESGSAHKVKLLIPCRPVLMNRELDGVEANLRYWRRQEQSGGHFWSALLRRVGANGRRCSQWRRDARAGLAELVWFAHLPACVHCFAQLALPAAA